MLGPVTWNTAQDWMNEWSTNNRPAVWYVYCNRDKSKCTVSKEPIGELMFNVLGPVDWNTAQNEFRTNNRPAVWYVYCNGDRSKCTVAKEPTGELMFNMLGPVDWNTAQDWMNEWSTNNRPAVWYVYCNGDKSKCTVSKEPVGELMFNVLGPVDWDTANAGLINTIGITPGVTPGEPTAGTTGAQGTPDGHIIGLVTDSETHVGISGVNIQVGLKTATTDPSGRYQIDIAPSTYEYVAKVPGYGDALGTLTVNSGQTTDGSFTMSMSKCTWSGKWNTDWGVMELSQIGSNANGNYTHDGGHIQGVVSGNRLVGNWSEAPSYSPPADAGDVELTMVDCGSLSGNWRYGSGEGWNGSWSGTRLP